MRFLGLEIKRAPVALSSPESSRGWWPIVRESFAGAWQQNVEVTLTDVLAHPIVFACVTLIASDIAKMRIKLVQLDERTGIWAETSRAAFSPVLRKPNHFQTRIEFIKNWIISKLIAGNAYILKARDSRGVVVAMYVLDPNRVRPLIAPDSSVYYELKRDDLSRQSEEVVIVPASEIIHDKTAFFYHPLVGLSPLYASGVAATMGLKIVQNSTNLYSNGSNPGGILTAPGNIAQDAADRIKAYWETEFSGDNTGKVAVLTNGLTFMPMRVNAVDSELSKQAEWVSYAICSTFHIPAYMVGVGPAPSYNNIEALNQQYYSQALQDPVESLELLLDEGLGLAPDKIDGVTLGTEMDLDNLLRMDTATQVKTLSEGVNSALYTLNSARLKINEPPISGGETAYLQQQYFSVAALAERDQNKPFSKPELPAASPKADQVSSEQKDMEDATGMLYAKAYAAGLYEPAA